MRPSRLTALGLTAALAVGGAAPTAAPAKAENPGRHTVIPRSTYVYVNAGVGFSGTLFKGETFKVTRISKSGKWARGMPTATSTGPSGSARRTSSASGSSRLGCGGRRPAPQRRESV